MLNRTRLIAVPTIIFSLFLASLFGGPTKRNIHIYYLYGAKPSGMAIAFSAPVALSQLFTAPPAMVYFKEVVADGERPALQIEQELNLRGGAAIYLFEFLLGLTTRIDETFGSNFSAAAAVQLGTLAGNQVVIIAPRLDGVFMGKELPRPRSDLLPENIFSALYISPSVSRPSQINFSSLQEVRDFIFFHRQSHATGTRKITAARIDSNNYPTLSMPDSLPAAALLDETHSLLHYISFGERISAFCARDGTGNRCSNKPDLLGNADRDALSRFELPALPAASVGNPVFSLLRKCEQESLSETEGSRLHQMIVRNSALFYNQDTTIPFQLAACGRKISDLRLVDYAAFLSRDDLAKKFHFVSPETFFKRVTGAPESENPAIADINWYSDYEFLFSENFEAWAAGAAQNIAGLDLRTAPSKRALNILVTALALQHRHASSLLAEEFARHAIFPNGLLTKPESEWIQKQLALL